MDNDIKKTTHSIFYDHDDQERPCEQCPIRKMALITTNPNVYNEHIFAITHELRSPLAVINGNTINQLNLLKQIYRNIEHTEENISLIKRIKDSILIIEDQVDNIENFISHVSEFGLYNESTNDTRVMIHMKSYLDQILKIAPTFSRSMTIFGNDNISYGDVTGKDFQNVHTIVNPQDLNRIIMNICTNAADAVTQLWKQKKYTSNFFPELKFRCIKSAVPNQVMTIRDDIKGPFGCINVKCSLFLVIEDNGPGISKEHLDNIFKYGFSTKKQQDSDHLGFGLHVCSQLAKRNNLSLFIQTGNNGTKFFIGFPDMIVAEPNTLEDKVLIKTINSNTKDYSLLNFSGDSVELYNESIIFENEQTTSIRSIQKENVDENDSIHVFKPKKKNK